MSQTQHPDFRYVEGLLQNDSSVILEIYDQFEDRIVRFVQQNQGKKEDGLDIFQEGIMVIFHKAQTGKFVLTASFFSFLYAVCRNLWLKEIRKRYGKEVTLHEDFEYKDEYDFEEAIFREERSKLVRVHFQKLSERCQKMLQLFYEETKKMVEIAQIMGFANANVAKKEKSKCQKRLVEAVRADTRFGDLRH